MSKELRLEPILISDALEIKDIMIKIVEDESVRWFKNGDKPYVPEYNSIEMQKYHTWDNKYYKIIYENNIVGVVLIYTTGKEHGRIDRFYILPEYQNLGMGSEVLKLVENLFQGINIWTLDTIQQSQRNHHFYEKNGYKLVGQDSEERYYCKKNNNINDKIEKKVESKNFSNSNLRNCDISDVDLYSCNMSNSKFSNMELCKNTYANSNLNNSRFTNDNMSNSVFGDSNMSKVEICHVSLTDAYIHDVNLDVDKENCNITIKRCDLNHSRIIDSNLQNLNIENCNIDGMYINGIDVEEMVEVYKKYKMK